VKSRPDAPLVLRAGRRARAVLVDRGFAPDLFSTLVGASGGPKWLVLSQLDRFLSDRVLAPRATPIDLIGSSIGSFRHACLAQRDPKAAIERFERAYLAQRYGERPGRDEVTQVSARLLGVLLGERGHEEIPANPLLRSHVVLARLRGFEDDGGLGFRMALAFAALSNAASRRSLGWFFERVVVSTHIASAPRYFDLPTGYARLDAESIAPAILAGGTIPLVMRAVRAVPGLCAGAYLDGGLLDYHFDFEFEKRPGLVLFPHFFDRIVPGWLDKALPWRGARVQALDEVLMIAPSPAFIATLPGGRVPDRADFDRLEPGKRHAQWAEVVDRCAALPEALDDLLARGDWVDAIEPFERGGRRAGRAPGLR
jgi:hypothetical protein